jgi:hypothetical protein
MSSVAAADKPAFAQNAQPAATRACEREGCTNAARSHCGKCRAVHYCGRECQQAAWPAHKWLCNPCVRIARGPASGVDDGRGARLVALKQFKEGDELARERPFARIAHADSVHATEAEAKRWGEGLWDDHVTTMSPGAARDLLYGLTDAWNDPPTAGGIARTNCLPLGDHNDSEGSGLFALICRANHACRPNARYIWRHDLQRELLLAVRDIAPGDEVTVTYGTSTEGRAQRQATLLRGFRFECKCELCETGDARLDKTLERIGELDDEIPVVANLNPKQAIRMAMKAIELCGSVGMGSGFYLKRFWHDAHQIASQLGNTADANRYYDNALACALLCEGGASPEGVRLPRY